MSLQIGKSITRADEQNFKNKISNHYGVYTDNVLKFCSSSATDGEGIDTPKAATHFRDSIINYYVKEIGQYYTFYSSGWQGVLDQALHYLPQDAYLFQLKAMAYYKQRKYQLGAPYLDSAVRYDREKYIDYRAFMKCIFEKDYREAIKDFALSKKEKGEHGIVMDHSYDFYMGVSYLQLNQFDSAQKYLLLDYKNVAATKGEDWISYLTPFYLGITFYEQKKFDSAIIYFNKSLKIYPQFCDGKCYKAICLNNKNQFSEAIDLLTAATQNIKQGYTINDANTKYEKYPYQVTEDLIELYKENIKRVSELYKNLDKERIRIRY